MIKISIISAVILIFQSVYAKDFMNKSNNSDINNQRIKILASPHWVHPSLRKNHAGYKKLNEQKQYSPMWRHTTNRPSGNVIGGGTTKYNDYKPLYLPPTKK